MTVEFTQDPSAKLYKSNANDLDVARAAWVSQNTEAHEKEAEPGRVEGLINFLLRENHTSPFEHGSFTFLVNCPLFVRSEFHRHRTMSYNEVSGRYTTMKPLFYTIGAERPVTQKGKVGAYNFSQDAMLNFKAFQGQKRVAELAWDEYMEQIDSGIANEVARMVLPVNLMTSFWATTNPLNLMRFLSLRTDAQALYEIRDVANDMENIFAQQMPMTHRAWDKHWR